MTAIGSSFLLSTFLVSLNFLRTRKTPSWVWYGILVLLFFLVFHTFVVPFVEALDEIAEDRKMTTHDYDVANCVENPYLSVLFQDTCKKGGKIIRATVPAMAYNRVMSNILANVSSFFGWITWAVAISIVFLFALAGLLLKFQKMQTEKRVKEAHARTNELMQQVQ